jgi:hypothetical protein
MNCTVAGTAERDMFERARMPARRSACSAQGYVGVLEGALVTLLGQATLESSPQT